MAANFGFVIDGELAGMACPGRFADLREDLTYLRCEGVGAIVSLTEYPLDQRTVEARRMASNTFTCRSRITIRPRWSRYGTSSVSPSASARTAP
ncbi:MAG: hypothetical protein ACREN5_14730 [Gemmatimonadales bacterium]